MFRMSIGIIMDMNKYITNQTVQTTTFMDEIVLMIKNIHMPILTIILDPNNAGHQPLCATT